MSIFSEGKYIKDSISVDNSEEEFTIKKVLEVIDKMSVTLNEIRTAASRISGSVHRTDVKTCSALNSMTGNKELFFKCEMWQKTGSFKARGSFWKHLSKIHEQMS